MSAIPDMFCENDMNIMYTKINKEGNTIKVCRTCGNERIAENPVLRDYRFNTADAIREKHRYYNIVVNDPTFPAIPKKCENSQCKSDRMKFVRDPDSQQITFICANPKCMQYWDAGLEDEEDVNKYYTITDSHW